MKHENSSHKGKSTCNQRGKDMPIKKKFKIYVLFECEEHLTEAPQKMDFRKHKRRVHKEYKSTCNQRGNKVPSGSELKICTLNHGSYDTGCSKCDEGFTLKEDPKEVWNPGIYVELNIAGNNLILLAISIKPAKIDSEISTKSKRMNVLNAGMERVNVEAS